MKGKYKVAFIIPVGANKILGEDGWEFQTSNRLSGDIKEFLVDTLKLEFSESYLGVDVYLNENMKMSVIRDDQGQIESISFQLYEMTTTALSDVFQTNCMADKSELFIPHGEPA